MIKVQINEAEITAALSAAISSLADMSRVMNKVGAAMRDQTEDRFKAGKGPDGTPWAPRSKTTLAIYEARKAKGGQKTWGGVLHYTGQLSNNIYHDYGTDFAQVGSAEPYAAAMQFGAIKGTLGAYWWVTESGTSVDGSSPWGNIPARPFLGISDQDREEILDLISDALDHALQP